MDIAEIERLATVFRSALERVPRTDFSDMGSLYNAVFPHACCDDASRLLAAYFVDHGAGLVARVSGCAGGREQQHKSHVWLLVGGVPVDITADQFNEEHGYDLPAVIIGETEFHRSFDCTVDSCADFRGLNMGHWNATSDYARVLREIEKMQSAGDS